MFRNDTQRAAACKALLRGIPKLERLWDGNPGPGSLLDEELGVYSTYEQVMVKVAIQIWTGGIGGIDGRFIVRFEELFGLDPHNMRRVATLLLALSGSSLEVDRWLLENAR